MVNKVEIEIELEEWLIDACKTLNIDMDAVVESALLQAAQKKIDDCQKIISKASDKGGI